MSARNNLVLKHSVIRTPSNFQDGLLSSGIITVLCLLARARKVIIIIYFFNKLLIIFENNIPLFPETLSGRAGTGGSPTYLLLCGRDVYVLMYLLISQYCEISNHPS